MFTLQVSKENTPVHGETQNILFLISLLDVEDKEEFADEFADTIWELVEARELSKTAYYKLVNHEIRLSDEKVLLIVQANEKALEWLKKRVAEKARKALKIVQQFGEEE
ncbi:hypothetical protein GFS03_08165 [Sulfolobus sp. E5-1-F]|nr:hypothetical protein GFS03_08165 [Sulfolobus sp. E5-1-F]